MAPKTVSADVMSPNSKRETGTRTAYAEDPLAMEVSYNVPRDSYLDPQYTAVQLAPELATLTAHCPPATFKRGDQTAKAKKVQDPQNLPVPLPAHGDHNNITLNPFALTSPTSLQLWHEGRTALSRPAYFYTTMHRHAQRLPDADHGRLGLGEGPAEDERFAVRVRQLTLEVEQGLADLRGLLLECHRVEDSKALEALRARVKGAVEGVL